MQDTAREPFALWQLTDDDFQPKMGVVLDCEYHPHSKTVIDFMCVLWAIVTLPSIGHH